MPDLLGVLDAFDRLVASAAESAPDIEVERAAIVGRRVRQRRGYAGETVVVALAGGTGSGKSSIVNALAGEDVAPSGAFRPTTSQPLALIPANPEPGLIRLLDDLGIEERVGQDRHPWLALIDLPDTDSVELEHRRIVERLLPEVDAVLWVVDPEKYQDRNLHAEHLEPLAGYAEQFLFALNQIDRIGPSDVPALAQDLRATLRADGIDDVAIVPTAADPDVGPREGMDELLLALRGLGDAKTVVHRKGIVDLSDAAEHLVEAAGAVGGGIGFNTAWDEVLERASEHIVADVLGPDVRRAARNAGRRGGRAAAGLLRRTDRTGDVDLSPGSAGVGRLRAIRVIDEYVAELAGTVTGDIAADITEVAVRIDQAVVEAAETVAYGESVTLPGPPSWTLAVAWLRRIAFVAAVLGGVWLFDVVRAGDPITVPVIVVVVAALLVVVPSMFAAGAGGRSALSALDAQRHGVGMAVRRELDRRLGRPLRDILRKRAGVTAAYTEFRLALADA